MVQPTSKPVPMLFGVKVVGWGLGLLLGLMPFHAFLTVYAGKLFGHQAIWQTWKEALITIITLFTLGWLIKRPQGWERLKRPVNYWLGAYLVVSLLVTLIWHPNGTAVLFGLKTSLEFVVVFMVAQIATDRFAPNHVRHLIMISGIVVATIAMVQMFYLPHDFLVQFGYGPSTIQPYLLVDPKVDHIRVLSTLGGPNQLGSYILIPLALFLVKAFRQPRRIFAWLGVVLTTIALIGSYSRSAWLGGIAVLAVVAFGLIPVRWRVKALIGTLVAAGAAGVVVSRRLADSTKLQYYLLHSNIKDNGFTTSTNAHGLALQQATTMALDHPLGRGLGSAGPASFHSSQPFISENYYLQVAIESGWLGLAAFLGGLATLGANLWERRSSDLGLALLAALVGISVTNLFLHSWADSSTALVFWIAAGVAIATPKEATRG